MKAFLSLLTFTSLFVAAIPQKELHWNWETIDTSDIAFPQSFEFCAATAEYQISGSDCYYEGDSG